jgi:alpha-D-ribose 1-methylphosphonate 5-triphosphate diphosphatase
VSRLDGDGDVEGAAATSARDGERDDAGAVTTVVENARVVTPEAVVEGGVRVEGDRIAAVGSDVAGGADRRIDAGGRLLLPGLVDLHGDDIESHVHPRSGVRVDTDVAFRSADCATVAAGITTKFHAVSFMDRAADDRSPALATALAERVDAADSLLADHRFHARCEITDATAIRAVEDVLDRGLVDVASVMTHIPGEGQYRNFDTFESWYATRSGVPREQARERWEHKRSFTDAELAANADRVIDAAQAAGVTVASHDDVHPSQVRRMAERGVDVCEYPVTMAAARAAHEAGLATAMGAPNLVRGGSQRGNLSTAAAIDEGVVDALLVDYHPPSLLAAPFVDTGEPLPERVARVTANPAVAAGLSDRGRIEPGARADLVVVDPEPAPTVRRAFVAGRDVYRTGAVP